MAECRATSCQYLVSRGNATDIPGLQANADISGIGVLIGFVGTAYITLILLVVYYVLAFDVEDPANNNPIDRGIAQWIWRRARRKPSRKWGKPLQRCILMLSDQHLVMGVAVLAGGYSQLRCGLSSYHWQTVISLAWFSSFTHLTTLTILRGYLRENPAVRLWRIFLMLLVAVGLGIALLPTGSGYWFNIMTSGENENGALVAGVPAVCFFDILSLRRYSAAFDQSFSMAFSLALLIYGYAVGLIRLFRPSSGLALRYLRTLPGDFWKRRIDRGSFGSKMFGLSLYTLIKAILDLLGSMLWEILWLTFLLAWGTVRLISTRQFISGKANEVVLVENFWSYSQYISVLLLVLPVAGIVQTCYETSAKPKKAKPHTNSPNPVPADVEHEHSPNAAAPPGYDRDFYRYIWFRTLVFSIIILALEMAAWFLYQLAALTSIKSTSGILGNLSLAIFTPALLLGLHVKLSLFVQDSPGLWVHRAQEKFLTYQSWTFLIAVLAVASCFLFDPIIVDVTAVGANSR